MIVTLKYVYFMMKADNHGEGGIMALMALGLDKVRDKSKYKIPLGILGLMGAAFFYGDGVITPAISVLSAVEGIEIISPSFKDLVIPLAIFILIVLFWFQYKGTAKIGVFFGPIMLIWFTIIAILGLLNIALNPTVLLAINPIYAFEFLMTHGIISFFALGAVVLCLTGAEALYADMGHFGKLPIRIVWISLVLPSLLLNYFGQGALLLAKPETLDNLFYLMAPSYLQTPLVIIATIATVIASQAVISGAFSMTKQAAQLGFLPRFRIIQTSAKEIGQIYVPIVNNLIMLSVIACILYFQSSNALGSAYGIAVTGTMLITDFLAILVCYKVWSWSFKKALTGASMFILIDLVFFTSNSLKIMDGGWVPLLISLFMIVIMVTWYKGRKYIVNVIESTYEHLDSFVDNKIPDNITRNKGTAVYLATNNNFVPTALRKTIYHFNSIHEKVVVLTIAQQFIPYVSDENRYTYENLDKGFTKLTINLGFMEDLDMKKIVAKNWPYEKRPDLYPISFFAYRQVVGINGNSGMSKIGKKLFRLIQRNAQQPMEYLNLPDDISVVVAITVEIWY